MEETEKNERETNRKGGIGDVRGGGENTQTGRKKKH